MGRLEKLAFVDYNLRIRETWSRHTMVIGSIEWLELLRTGAFANRPPVVACPPKRIAKPKAQQMVKGAGEYCTYCRREMVPYSNTHPTRDHVIPKSKGGRKTVWCCTKCNNAKGDMLPEEWQRFMQDFPDWWKIAGREAAGRKAILARRNAVAGAIPEKFPKVYNDPKRQAGFEHAYKGRLWLLRLPDEGESNSSEQ
jgi:hypothetical protein